MSRAGVDARPAPQVSSWCARPTASVSRQLRAVHKSTSDSLLNPGGATWGTLAQELSRGDQPLSHPTKRLSVRALYLPRQVKSEVFRESSHPTKHMISILASTLALSPGAPKLEQRVTARVAASRAAFSLGPALTAAALPAHAEPLQALALDSQQAALPTSLLADGDGGGIFGLIATVIVAGLGLFIVNFIKDAALECARQLP